MNNLLSDLTDVMKRHDSVSGTPPGVVASYLFNCLAAFDAAVNRRAAELEQLRQEGME